MNNKVANPAFDRSKIFALIAWIFLLAGYWWYTSANSLTPSQTMEILIDFISESPYGFLIYTLIYMIRPVFLFPATLVTMAATYLYGPVRGIAYALIASNLSTMVAFLIGRFFGGSFLRNMEKNALVSKYADRLRHESFQTTLVLRFLFLPYDLVSYFSGFLNIDLRWFMLATVLGSIPGTISFGMLGASIEGDFASQSVSFDPLSLVISARMFAVSIGLYRFVRRREKTLNP
ncbi:MAG: VTT domain-containing protein [Anaerolineae bacterium]|nr:VTT domain-containing protein [Anaerolineae bacterium]MCI0609158.1 VTT domain-containing protein [Anaerolineae bacterium]